MKFNLNLKEKAINIEADIEGLVKAEMDHRKSQPEHKTRYQIKQEEKRKQLELEHKQFLHYIYLLLGLIAVIAVIGILASILGI